ncbi:linamarin synthase 2-like [Malus domestica]|uniref:linamarin synthase 2-like n=1 Tax=Malus domestica TaxID=3750 RepID=UPI0039748780
MMTNQHLIEFAWGLANSKHPFLWIVKAGVVKVVGMEVSLSICNLLAFFCGATNELRYSCTTWEIGMEVSPDVKCHEIEELVIEMLEGEGGMKMREKAKEWRKKAVEGTDVGGSSYNNFERFFMEALQLGESLATR